MQIELRGPNGITRVTLATSVQKMLAANGQASNQPPGKAAMEILAGWPHGSAAGLPGVDFRNGNGVHRGESFIIGPSWDDFSNSEDICQRLLGFSQLTSPQNPRGSWIIPQRIPIPAAVGPDPSIAVVQLTQPTSSRLYALEVTAIRGTPVGEAVNPCPCEGPCGCCGTSWDKIFIGNWESRQFNTTYPNTGRDSKITTTPAGGAPTTVDMEWANNVAPACNFSSKRLLDGQNFLPPWVQHCELKRNNDDLRFTIFNFDAAFAAEVYLNFHMAYGTFVPEQYAAACGCAA